MLRILENQRFSRENIVSSKLCAAAQKAALPLIKACAFGFTV
jgi:hypothetical protein